MAQNSFRQEVASAPRTETRGPMLPITPGQLINTKWLTENFGYIAFCAFLGIIYIANSHNAVRTIREINQINEDLKKITWESNSMKSELMFSTMQSQVAKKVAPMGLEELRQPPFKIKN